MTKSVLVVEDNDLNMKLFHDLLEAQGYAVLQTRDGMEALKIAREHRPDLILMDIQLPEVSGLEVTKWLKEDESGPETGAASENVEQDEADPSPDQPPLI